jgi:hypothetical protein
MLTFGAFVGTLQFFNQFPIGERSLIMEGKFTGSCHCGKVAIAIDGKILNVVNCHCSICRKLNGGAFASYVIVPEQAFEVVRGKELLTRYAMSEMADKHFCSICGAPVVNRNKKYEGVAIIHLGCLDEPGKMPLNVNIYCESMLPWVAFSQDFPRFEKGMRE